MKVRAHLACLVTFLSNLVLALPATADPFTTLHQFSSASYAAEGAFPWAGVAVIGSTLYGTTQIGGSANRGTIFKLNSDGSGYQVLRNFSGTDGQGYHSSLVSDGSMLYGITGEGGTLRGAGGTLFEMKPDGSDFQVLHNFAGPPNDGAYAEAGLTVVGSTLYGISGTTTVGGGTIFKQDVGGAYQVLHAFSQVANADMTPTGFERPLVDGTTIFGTSESGGVNKQGAIFTLNTDGTGFQLLHSFDSHSAGPTGSLALGGTTLYGTTHSGGAFGYGTVFKLNIDGTDFQVLYSFAGFTGGPIAGYPVGGLVLHGSTLYGTSSVVAGAVFQLKTDGTGFQMLTPNFGAEPNGDLTLSGVSLFGAMQGSPDFGNSYGNIFAIAVPEPSALTLAGLGVVGLLARRARRAIVERP